MVSSSGRFNPETKYQHNSKDLLQEGETDPEIIIAEAEEEDRFLTEMTMIYRAQQHKS